MDADLFGDSLKKKGSTKGSGKGSKPTTPRRGGSTPRSNSITPRSAGDRAGSPTHSETATSPPGSARGSLKKKPVKPSSSINMPPPGTAPGKMTGM